MTATRWRRGTFRITTRPEHPNVETRGHLSPSGRWGLYRMRSSWNVTHLPTGLLATHSGASLAVTTEWLDRIDAQLGPVTDAEGAEGIDAFKRRVGAAIVAMPLPGVEA